MQINVGIKKITFIFAAPNEGKVHQRYLRESDTYDYIAKTEWITINRDEIVFRFF
jgi:hypothetical protein